MNVNTLQRTLRRFGASVLGVASVLAASASPAMGQVSEVEEPYVVVVDEATAPLRCGADELYYEVGELKQGSMLLVDASDTFGVDGDGWLRVSLPADQPALIKALPEHLDVDTMRNTVTLLRPSRLIALSTDGDLSQSWKKLLTKPMEPGSTLKIIETIRDESGEPLAYIVPAPEQARGFVHGRFVRQATSSEAVAFRAGQAQAEATTTVAQQPEQYNPHETTIDAAPVTKPVETASAPVATPEPVIENTIDETQTAQADAQTDAQTGDPSPLPEMPAIEGNTERATTTIAQNEDSGSVGDLLGVGDQEETEADAPAMDVTHATRPLRIPRVIETPADRIASAESDDDDFDRGSAAHDSSEEEAVEAEPIIENRPLPTMRDLETAYAAVLAQKSGMAELEPLIGEHERYLAAMDSGEAPGDELDREVIVAHLELLKIRADLQRSMLRIEGVRELAKRNIDRIDEGIAGIDRSSEYVVVGRLTTSVVYDGKRLPLLYRVQSIDEDSGRTLAYVVPANGVDLSGSLGSIVGVAGSARIDASSRLNIVTPQRVDKLRAGATAAVQ